MRCNHSLIDFRLFLNIYWEVLHSKTTQEEFEDTKGVIRIRKSKKVRQQNGQQKKDKAEKDKPRSVKQCTETKDRSTRTPLKSRENSGSPEG